MLTIVYKTFNKIIAEKQGVALFISILMSFSLAVIALVSMNRMSEAAHVSGKSLQERRLLLYGQSASNIVMAEVQDRINTDIVPQMTYNVSGTGGATSFRYYPVDINVNGKTTVFAYRGVARRFANPGDTPPGFRAGQVVPSNGLCYDIVVDVAEVIAISDGNVNAPVELRLSNRYYLGRMKTIGVISCFQKGE